MIYKNLYIIGNGFDQHHEIPCGFHDFMVWVKCHNPWLFIQLTQVYDNAWEEYWWRDFENSLTEISISYYANKKGNLYDPEYIREGAIEEKTEYASHKVNEEFSAIKDSLKTDFQKWLVKAYEKCNKNRKIQLRAEDSIFLSFNYTKTLEDLYEIDNKQIYHIHGIIDDKDSMVFGHGSNKEELNDILESQKPRVVSEVWDKKLNMMIIPQYVVPEHKRLAIHKTIDSLLTLNKNVKECIEKNYRFFDEILDVQKIYVYGFSFSPIDMPYLEKIMRRTSSETHWVISWYSQDDKRRIMDFVIRYNIRNITMINGIRTICIQ